MLVQEFTSRTGYVPTEEEWKVANAMYMDCELDKDKFCRLWKQMNKAKVDRQKAEKKRISDLWKKWDVANKNFVRLSHMLRKMGYDHVNWAATDAAQNREFTRMKEAEKELKELNQWPS